MRTLVGEPSAKVLVLSDENLLGNPFSYPHGEAIYPNCQSRLKATSRVVFKPPQRVHLTIRNYATFLVSVYAMSALYRPEAPAFETVKDRFLRLDQRWPAVLRATRYVFSNSKITFSRYENTPIQTALVALVEPEVTLRRIQEPIQQRVNVAPTVEAIEEALRSPPASPGEADSLVFKLAAGTPFDPLSPDEKAELSEIYEADIRALKKEFTEIDDSMIETTASEPSRASGTGN